MSPLRQPHIVDFVLDAAYLNITTIYPRQLLVLKLVFAESALLTDYDREVLDRWTAGFRLTEDRTRFEGGYGVTPDVVNRIEALHRRGRSHFREVILVLGRRASKNWLGAVCGAYTIWKLLCMYDPQGHFGIDTNKALSVPVFAGQAEQARLGQWRDLVERIKSAPCFQPYIAEETSRNLRLWTPRQLAEGAAESQARGLIEITAKEATSIAGRGPAAAAMFFDEMAHMNNAGANRDAEEVYSAALPALAQCRSEEFIFESSSPASQLGRFYENYLRALEVDDDGTAVYPDSLVLQLPSWDLYEDFERTVDGIEAYPGGPLLPVRSTPLVVYDEGMRYDERSNPETFAVEFWAQWRSSPDRYLPHDQVLQIFEPFNGRILRQEVNGRHDRRYVMHVDPSKSQANTALIIVHGECPDGELHMFVDYSNVWQPRDFPDSVVDPRITVAAIKELLKAFPTSVLTFDQFNSIGSILELREFVAQAKLPVRTQISERTANASRNWRQAEQFKTMLGQGRIHAPHDDRARDELLALVEKNGRVSHPSAGPIQTDDLADCFFNALDTLVGPDYGHLFSQARLRLSQPSDSPFTRNPDIDAQFAASRRYAGMGHGAPRLGSGGPARGDRFGRRP